MNPMISLTACATATETKDARAVAVVEAVRSGRWRETIERIRAEYQLAGKEAIDGLKKRLPGVLVSGKFERRCAVGLVAHSGLLCADLDCLGARLADLRQQLAKDPHVWALFLSPTGTGLKVWFRVPADAALHAASFASVQHRCRELYDVEIDVACKDVARLCFVSYDPEAFLNRDAAELALVESRKQWKAAPSVLPANGTLPPSVDRLLGSGAQSGERNAQAFKLACQLRDAGLSELEAENPVLEFAARCTPVLATREALATLRSAYATPPRAPARSTEPSRLRIGGVASEYLPADSPDAQTFARLATLPLANYDRCRETEAEKLGIRVATLDAEVAKCRAPATRNMQGGAVEFPDVAPWPQSVAGADVLNAIADTFSRFIVLPEHAAHTLALWTAHVHSFEAFLHSPRLNLCSPEKGCGKTLVLDVLAALVPRPLRTESITPAVLFRLVEIHKPVLLLDEIDTYLHEADELRGLLNAGHKRGAKAFRCEGEKNEVRAFAAFAPAVLAGIGSLPGTLHDRSIVVRLTRAKPGEIAARFDSRHTVRESELCRKLARWTADNLARLENLDPALPESAFNRLADNWRPLFAIAEIVGADWPGRARAAFVALTTGDDLDAHGIGTALLSDIRRIFAVAKNDRLPSARIAEALAAMEGQPWPEFGTGGKPISTNQLARLLGRFNIRSRTVRIADGTAKGYHLTDFEDAFARFLPAYPISNRHTVTTPVNIGDSPLFETSHPGTLLPFENAVPTNKGAGCDGVTVRKGVP